MLLTSNTELGFDAWKFSNVLSLPIACCHVIRDSLSFKLSFFSFYSTFFFFLNQTTEIYNFCEIKFPSMVFISKRKLQSCCKESKNNQIKV